MAHGNLSSAIKDTVLDFFLSYLYYKVAKQWTNENDAKEEGAAHDLHLGPMACVQKSHLYKTNQMVFAEKIDWNEWPFPVARSFIHLNVTNLISLTALPLTKHVWYENN